MSSNDLLENIYSESNDKLLSDSDYTRDHSAYPLIDFFNNQSTGITF